ncbi:unnamed protein product, partial [Prorocentrum cordatum]
QGEGLRRPPLLLGRPRRRGPDNCGWWFGPEVGGDQVWAYHPGKAQAEPPASEWSLPIDGSVDAGFRVQALTKEQAERFVAQKESETAGAPPAAAKEAAAQPAAKRRQQEPEQTQP